MTQIVGGASKRLPFPRLMAFSLGAIPGAMLLMMMGTYLPRFYAGHIGIGLTVLGLTIAAVRLTDLFVDLSLGWAMDKTRTPFGRYKVWFCAALPVVWLGVWKVFNPPVDADVAYLVRWLLFLYVGYSMVALSHAAWGASLSVDYKDRSRIFGWMHGIAVLGSVTLLMSPYWSGGTIKPGAAASFGTIGTVIIIISTVVMGIALLFTPETLATEKKERATLQDYLAVIKTPSMLRLIAADLFLVLGPGTTGPIFIFFVHDAKNFPVEQISTLLVPYVAAGLIGALFWARVAQSLGKHRTVQIACVCYAVTQTALMAIPAGLFWPTFVGMFSVGFSVSAFLLLVRAMVGDVSDQVRLETGKERSGVLFALVTMTQKFGTSMTASIILPILEAVGYNPKDDAINTPGAIWGLEMCYLFAPIVLTLIGGALFFGYKLDAKTHADISAALAERDRLDAQPA